MLSKTHKVSPYPQVYNIAVLRSSIESLFKCCRSAVKAQEVPKNIDNFCGTKKKLVCDGWAQLAE